MGVQRAWSKLRPSRGVVALTILLLASLLPPAPVAARDWAPMPWGLATIWWDYPPQTAPFRSISLDMEIGGEAVGASRVYVAVIGGGNIAGAPIYAGLQSNGKLPRGATGPLGIFSRWNERSPDAVRVAPGGYAESAGYEGDFISVRQTVPWRQGRYRVSLVLEPPGADGRPWVRAEVLELASGKSWLIGSLRFPGGTEPQLSKSIASFVEIFGQPVAPESVPRMAVILGNLRINDLPVMPTGGAVLYKDGIPPLAKVTPYGAGSVRVDVGGFQDHSALPIDGRGIRQQRLRW